MDANRPLSRRRMLARVGAAGVLGALAGCTDGGDGDGGSTDDGGTSSDDGPDDDGPGNEGPGDESSDSDDSDTLDLREANVVDVSFEAEGGAYSVAVTLHHDDDGEDGYANWWQVERLDGTRLGRRKLRHAHSRQPFTRNETVEIPDDVACVVVRGHDQTHGYGGRAAVVNLDSGASSMVEQGPERQQLDVGDCPG